MSLVISSITRQNFLFSISSSTCSSIVVVVVAIAVGISKVLMRKKVC